MRFIFPNGPLQKRFQIQAGNSKRGRLKTSLPLRKEVWRGVDLKLHFDAASRGGKSDGSRTGMGVLKVHGLVALRTGRHYKMRDAAGRER